MSGKTALIIKHNYQDGNHRSKDWSDFDGKTVKNSTVILKGFGDVHPYREGPRFLAERVFVYNCDKNFVYYWIDKHTFPNMKELYLMSHPCEPQVLFRDIEHIYLIDNYYRCYKDRWAPRNDNVVSMENTQMESEMKSYQSEDVIME